MTLEEFMASQKGSKLAPLLADPRVIARMKDLSKRSRPAVKAIDEDVAMAVQSLNNVEKQHVGRWVRDILSREGLKPIKQLDWRGGKVFSSGSVYGPIADARPVVSAPDQPEANDGVVRARALLAAGRLDATRPLDTVDAFLADRSSAWVDA